MSDLMEDDGDLLDLISEPFNAEELRLEELPSESSLIGTWGSASSAGCAGSCASSASTLSSDGG